MNKLKHFNKNLNILNNIIDFRVQQILQENRVINYLSRILPNSKLIALKNRGQGDCLLDSLMQTLFGCYDENQILRNALFESMKTNTHSGKAFYNVFKRYEYEFAYSLNFQTNEQLIEQEYREQLNAAERSQAQLGQIHLFVLAHILRRPIICYSVGSIKSLHNPVGVVNEDLDYSTIGGIYLPVLFWDQNKISRTPVAIAYTRFHFSALVNGINIPNNYNEFFEANINSLNNLKNPKNLISNLEKIHHENLSSLGLPMRERNNHPRMREKKLPNCIERDLLLPLMDTYGQLLALPYVKTTIEEQTNDEYYKAFLTQYLDIVESDAGIYCAVQIVDEASLHHSRLLVNDWLAH